MQVSWVYSCLPGSDEPVVGYVAALVDESGATRVDGIASWADPNGVARLAGPRSSGWAAVEKAHIKLQPQCQVCNCKHDLQVHHKKPFHLHPELELDPANLITLCQPHHLLVGHLMLWASFNENVVKDAEAWNGKIKDRPKQGE